MRALGVVAVCFASVISALADDDEFSKEQIEKWGEYYAARAAKYDIRNPSDAEAKLQFHDQPVLRWSNPVISNGSTHGACFLWTREGRPEVFASIFSYRPSRDPSSSGRTVAHVFNPLSTEPLIADWGEEVFWRPLARRAEEFVSIPNAPEPANTRASRLSQMRQLSREFAATSGGTGRDEELPLRLLSQPVYRNDRESDAVLDGALFAFVTGTDPELLLLIEARRQGDKSVWQALTARHSHLTLRLEHRGVEVWKSVRGEYYTTAPEQNSYLSQHGIDRQGALLP